MPRYWVSKESDRGRADSGDSRNRHHVLRNIGGKYDRLFHEPLFHASRIFTLLLLDTRRSWHRLRQHGHPRSTSRRHALDIYILSILTSLVAANSRFLLGKNQIFGFNLTFVLQGGLLFFVLLFLYYGLKIRNVTAYLWGMYFTNGIAFLVSLFLLLPFLNKKEADPRKGRSQYALLKEMFAYGLWGSADNIAEILTTRLNYFLIQRFAGLGSVGLLDAGTKISESVWHINRSIGFITYSRVARTHKPGEQKQITLRFFKLTFCAITLATGCILLIPEWIYTDYLFSAEFVGMHNVITGCRPES